MYTKCLCFSVKCPIFRSHQCKSFGDWVLTDFMGIKSSHECSDLIKMCHIQTLEDWVITGLEYVVNLSVTKPVFTHWGQATHIGIILYRPSLVETIACCLVGAKPLSELMLDYSYVDTWEHISVNCESKQNNFIQESEFEDVVCKNKNTKKTDSHYHDYMGN